MQNVAKNRLQIIRVGCVFEKHFDRKFGDLAMFIFYGLQKISPKESDREASRCRRYG